MVILSALWFEVLVGIIILLLYVYLARHKVDDLQEGDSGAEDHVVRHPGGGDLARRHGPHNLTTVLQEHELSAGIYGLPGGIEKEEIAIVSNYVSA